MTDQLTRLTPKTAVQVAAMTEIRGVFNRLYQSCHTTPPQPEWEALFETLDAVIRGRKK